MPSLLSSVAPPPARMKTYLESSELLFEVGDDGVSRLRELTDEQVKDLQAADEALTESRDLGVGALKRRQEELEKPSGLTRAMYTHAQSNIARFRKDLDAHDSTTAQQEEEVDDDEEDGGNSDLRDSADVNIFVAEDAGTDGDDDAGSSDVARDRSAQDDILPRPNPDAGTILDKVHSPWEQWCRKVMAAKDEDAEKKYRCSACPATYGAMNKLQSHLETRAERIVDSRDSDDAHYLMLKEDGWLFPTFQNGRRDDDQYQQICRSRKNQGVVRYGRLRHLDELTQSRPANISGTASRYVTVGPSRQDFSKLKYPETMQDGPAMPTSFEQFGGERENRLLSDVLKRSGMTDEEIFGDRNKLPKF